MGARRIDRVLPHASHIHPRRPLPFEGHNTRQLLLCQSSAQPDSTPPDHHGRTGCFWRSINDFPGPFRCFSFRPRAKVMT
jgi:hypothetical protein